MIDRSAPRAGAQDVGVEVFLQVDLDALVRRHEDVMLIAEAGASARAEFCE